MKLFSMKKFFRKFKSQKFSDIGIDLGTSNTIIYVKGKGIIVNEPTYASVNIYTDEVEIIGSAAREIVGRTANHTKVVRPMKYGVISDYGITEKMLEKFVEKANEDKTNPSRIVVAVPSGVTQVEKRAVMDVVENVGAEEVYLISEAVAAAIGCGIDVFQPKGYLVVDIGGGTTEIAFIVYGGVAYANSIKVAGDRFNEKIIEYLRQKYDILVGEKTAEELKIYEASETNEVSYKVKGRELLTGLPKVFEVTSVDLREALKEEVKEIVDSIKIALESIEPEVSSDVFETGITLCGGGANIKFLAEEIQKAFNLEVHVAEDPLYGVIRGISTVLEDFNKYKAVLLSAENDY